MDDLMLAFEGSLVNSASNGVVYLPAEVVVNILSRLPIKSILRFKTVCKAWNDMTLHPAFILLQRQRSVAKPSQLIVLKTASDGLLLVDKEGRRVGEINDLAEGFKSIMGSYAGMLCVSKSDELSPAIIWNPLIRDYITLPGSDYEFSIFDHYMDIGFDPYAKKYKVVRVYNNTGEHGFTYEIITLGASSWRKLVTPYNILEIAEGTSIFMDGYFYWMVTNEDFGCWEGTQILSLDVAEESFQSIALPSDMKIPLSEFHRIKWKMLNVGRTMHLIALDNQRIKEDEQHYYQVMHVWELIRSKVEGLHMRYQCTTKLYSSQELSYEAAISEGSNNSYLLRACRGYWCYPQLVKYDIRQKRSFLLHIPGSGQWHSSTGFEPSLICPSQVLHNS